VSGGPHRERWTRALTHLASVLVVAVYWVQRSGSPNPPDRSLLLAVALTILLSAGVEWRPGLTSLFGALAAVPALVVGRLWLYGGPSGSFGWFAYAPLSSVVYSFPAARSASVGLVVVSVLLWIVSTLGLVGLVARVRPGPGSMRVLAVVATVLTVPLWELLGRRPSPWHLTTSTPDLQIDAVRYGALALVVLVGAGVVASTSRVPARAAAYLAPAAAMTWVLFHVDVTVYELASGGQALPGWIVLLPFYAAPVVAFALTLVLWVLTARGLRQLYVRSRPPAASFTP
jgi:hypothetical protein